MYIKRYLLVWVFAGTLNLHTPFLHSTLNLLLLAHFSVGIWTIESGVVRLLVLRLLSLALLPIYIGAIDPGILACCLLGLLIPAICPVKIIIN